MTIDEIKLGVVFLVFSLCSKGYPMQRNTDTENECTNLLSLAEIERDYLSPMRPIENAAQFGNLNAVNTPDGPRIAYDDLLIWVNTYFLPYYDGLSSKDHEQTILHKAHEEKFISLCGEGGPDFSGQLFIHQDALLEWLNSEEQTEFLPVEKVARMHSLASSDIVETEDIPVIEINLEPTEEAPSGADLEHWIPRMKLQNWIEERKS